MTGGSGRQASETLTVQPIGIEGRLTMPADGQGLVIVGCCHDGADRGGIVSAVLTAAGLGTFVLDLLLPEEAATSDRLADTELLAERFVLALGCLEHRRPTRGLPYGCLGFGTAVAGAIRAASEVSRPVQAIVGCAGRPDMAGDFLEVAHAPTLLIVGGADGTIQRANELAMSRLGGPKRLAVIETEGHLLDEPQALHGAAELATDWFRRHLIA